jgi:branched-chain amino acid transport system permease protein
MKNIYRGCLFLILLCFFLLPYVASDYYIALFFNVLMWIALTVSWVILSGYSGYISLAHSAFFGLGAYFMALTWSYLPYLLIIFLAGVLSGGFALAIGLPFLKVRGPYFVILTLGLTEFVKFIFVNLEIKLGGTVGRVLIQTPSLISLYYCLLIVSLASIVTAIWIKRSKFGVALLSIKEDEDTANSVGINTTLYKLLAFGISSFTPGMVGAILALRHSYIDPYTVFSPIISFQVIVMAFLGGVEKVHSAILGVVMLTFLSEALWVRYPHAYLIILGVIVIIVVKFMPLGMLHYVEVILKRKIHEFFTSS